ncbi:hypothetical protein V6N13_009494 [Hibiscus sabdariffa]|uniref:Uncharacterized protein n=2 Tax=Hibiscus sabdariffa TaxID=183260 RepID=A0ABR2AT96_9ROSI
MQFSHLVWVQTDRKSYGLGDLKYPLISDVTKSISKSYTMLIPNQVSLFSAIQHFPYWTDSCILDLVVLLTNSMDVLLVVGIKAGLL